MQKGSGPVWGGLVAVTNDTAGLHIYPYKVFTKRFFNFKVPVVKLHVGRKVRRCHFLTRLDDACLFGQSLDRARQLEYAFAGSIRSATLQTEELKSIQIQGHNKTVNSISAHVTCETVAVGLS